MTSSADEPPRGHLASGIGVAERMAAGRSHRDAIPRRAHGVWEPSPQRPDPLDLLESQSKERLPSLVPIRYGRMATSPFAFCRGAALVMADDLSRTSRTSITVQACGDAHLANFGIFATPERNIVFDVNDFDETLPGPWEWDVKRLAASFVLAGRHRGFDREAARASVASMLRAYQGRMRRYAHMGYLDTWYAGLDVEELLPSLRSVIRNRTEQSVERARLHETIREQGKLTEVVDGERRFVDRKPLLWGLPRDAEDARLVRDALADYARTLRPDRRMLLARYRLVDVAMKVVGVGSVGTRCMVALLQGRDDGDPLLLQIKEATASVLEQYLPRSRYRHHGQRVVMGQQLSQPASDMFLGWIQDRQPDPHHYYWRQLRDVKGSIDLDKVGAGGLRRYAKACGAALARTHARSGDPAVISGYLGTGDAFEGAFTAFAESYADQTERDHARLVKAIRSGRIQAVEDE